MREPLRAMNDQLVERFAERGHSEVRYAHGNVFQYLDDAGTRVGVLAERAGVTKQSMAQLVEHLELHGYVERAPDPADRRAKLVCLTDRGRAIFVVVREFIAEMEARLDTRMSPAKVRRLRGLLEELADAVAPGR
jgi:DNA-binding MarR family transcriptional regulator